MGKKPHECVFPPLPSRLFWVINATVLYYRQLVSVWQVPPSSGENTEPSPDRNRSSLHVTVQDLFSTNRERWKMRNKKKKETRTRGRWSRELNKLLKKKKKVEETDWDGGTQIDGVRQADGETSEQIGELVMDGCWGSREREQDRSCLELLVWTDGCLCANYRLSAWHCEHNQRGN